MLETRPEVYEDLSDVYEGFYWLSAGRQFNEAGPQPIPLADMIAYLSDRRVVDPDERREFQHLIRVMDGRFLKIIQDKMASERARLMNSSKSSKR